MSIGADIAAGLPELIGEAESLMTSMCVVSRSTGGMVYDPDTGLETTTRPETVYSGRCRVQERATQVQEADVSGSTVTLTDLHLHIPVSAPRVAPGDVAEIIGGLPGYLVGARYRIQRDHLKTHQVDRRLPVEAIG